MSSTVSTHAPTEANRANLAESFLEEVRARYAGTRLGRQELDGVLLDEAEGALWTTRMLEELRVPKAPDLDRIVVAVDPLVPIKAVRAQIASAVNGIDKAPRVRISLSDTRPRGIGRVGR